jgi:hypothetical protein
MLGVTVVPFPTAVLAQNLRDPLDVKIAAIFYNGWFTFIAIMFNALLAIRIVGWAPARAVCR